MTSLNQDQDQSNDRHISVSGTTTMPNGRGNAEVNSSATNAIHPPVGTGGGGGGGGGRSSVGSYYNNMTMSSTNEAFSPFLNNLLRFSPKQHSSATGYHLSPLHRRGPPILSSTTTQQQQQQQQQLDSNRTRFFDTSRNNQTNQDFLDKTNSSNFPGEHSDGNVDKDMDGGNTSTSTASKREGGLVMDGIPIDHLRTLVKEALLTSPISASFYSRILFSKTGQPSDALLLAQAHYLNHKYEACLRILEESELLQQSQHEATLWEAVLIAAHALIAKRDWTSLIDMIEDVCRLPDHSQSYRNNDEELLTGKMTFHALLASQPLEDDDQIGWSSLKRIVPSKTTLHPLSILCWYRGLAYHETGCSIRATTFWKLAICMDCQCQQAWESLLEKKLLTVKEAHDLIMHDVNFNDDQDWLRSLYLARIELTTPDTTSSTSPEFTQDDPISITLPGTSLDASSIHLSTPIPTLQLSNGMNIDFTSRNEEQMARKIVPSAIQHDVDQAFDNLWNKYALSNSPQVLAIAARRSYRRYDWKSALLYCQDLAQLDPTVEDAAFCYIATLVMLGHKRVLFRLAHEWVDAAPKSAQSWFAVGAYYYSIQRYHVAQRHFCRATRMNPQCTEAWIALGCSFAACDESDQALASYRAAQRLSPGEHSSLLYMGMEYIRTNHLVLASHFLQAALSASEGDPLCLHEMGLLAAQNGDHKNAIDYFCQALNTICGGESLQENVDLCHETYWEPTIFNLGHSYRKYKQFDNALICFNRCVALCPTKFSVYSAIAYTKHLMGDIDSAISYYHRALGWKPDDPFSTDMLSRALQDQITTITQDIFSLCLPTNAMQTAEHSNSSNRIFTTPSIAVGQKKFDSEANDDMELDLDMSSIIS